jgi:hypothetical protein
MLHTVVHFHFFLPLFMCCSSTGPKCTAKKIVRVGFGLALAFVGFAHYQDPLFAESVGRGLNALESLGMIWGYILPGLFILGGLLLAFGIYANVAAGITAVALVSIPAGLMLKSAIGGIGLDVTMPPAMNALVWIAVFLLVLKKRPAGMCGSCCGMDGCACGMDNCNCEPEMPVAKPAMKSAPAMPMATKAPSMPKPAPKKMPAKKAASKSKK